MNDYALTKEERLCLQGWFRQAIAKVEREEATAQFIQTHGIDTTTDSHRSPLVRRRTRRSRVFSHVRELAI